MFLVEDNRHGATYLVFTWEDPRKAGYSGPVTEGVTLDYDWEAVHAWPEGHARPEASVGREPGNPTHYKVFKYGRELEAAGYEPVTGTAVQFGSWRDYANLHLLPPNPEQTDDVSWYDYLDRVDEASRGRRGKTPAAPASNRRDDVAAWVANKHLIVDSSLREVWYLPRGAPPEEIRLLEVTNRWAGAEAQAEAIDFGLDVEGANYRLLVADVTSDQLGRITNDAALLPPGWSLGGDTVWRRGA